MSYATHSSPVQKRRHKLSLSNNLWERASETASTLWIDQLAGLESSFAERISSQDNVETVSTCRERLSRTVCQALSSYDHMLIRSPEGIGKSSALMNWIALDIFDTALGPSYSKDRFTCFACRSNAQAESKASEYRASGQFRNAVVLRSFWEHYKAACEAVELQPVKRREFPDQSIHGILDYMLSLQPDAFAELEKRRQSLWRGEDGSNLFDSAMTILFTSHALARTWHKSHITRLWYHPDFSPSPQTIKDEKGALTFTHIVVDEPEIDTVLYRIPDPLLDWLKRVKRLNRNWKKKTCKERVAIYEAEKRATQIPGNYSFDQCDEWLRFPHSRLKRYDVDYEAIPFGYDTSDRGVCEEEQGAIPFGCAALA